MLRGTVARIERAGGVAMKFRAFPKVLPMSPEWTCKRVEAPPGIEPGMEVLQFATDDFPHPPKIGRFAIS
jgi:hypothetical protein